MQRYSLILLTGVLSLFLNAAVIAQDGTDPLKYSSLAQLFSRENTNGDANSGIIPSVAMENGFGSYLDNPASMAMIGTSYFNLGFLSNSTDQKNTFLGNSTYSDFRSGRISNIGILYSVPTVQGSLVVGGGYDMHTNINRTNIVSAFNDQSTITDVFQEPSSDYYDIAFNTYAIDYYDDTSDDLESIFRIGFDPSDYPGIHQDVEVNQRGHIGEFSLFAASEISKNLFAGASLGVTFGSFAYRRNFLESDLANAYNGDFIEGSDISYVQLTDEIDTQISGLTARFGLVYKILPFLNVGTSLTLPSRLIITESYYSSIETGLDDNSSPFIDDFEGDFSYSIRKPGRLNLGIAIDDLNGFSVSGSYELIDYSSTDINLTRDSGIDFVDETTLRGQEAVLDSTIQATYQMVQNIRMGVEYRTIRGVEFRAGLGLFPGKSKIYVADRIQFGGGIGIPLSQDIFLDVSVKYATWNDRSQLYEYYNRSTGVLEEEISDQTIDQLTILAGIKVRL
ncbi:MAG TPA: hypothetical protein DEQ34_04900 [Balneolaceae bacterium]|nr:hypothetical protein [Balneolaceae bacterium]